MPYFSVRDLCCMWCYFYGRSDMYAKRIQLINYGPIDRIDITFPFDGDSPKPVVLVGENGTGKSILQSHLVNGLLIAQGIVYPAAPEMIEGQVFKLRGNGYIKVNREFYYARVDYENSLFVEEIRMIRPRRTFPTSPEDLIGTDSEKLWSMVGSEEHEMLNTNLHQRQEVLKEAFSNKCVLYFPPDRFEEPAWLNKANLNARAQFMESKTLRGDTNRSVVNFAPLGKNQNWLFEVVYDSRVFEAMESYMSLPIEGNARPANVPVFHGYHGQASRIVEIAIHVLSKVLRSNRSMQLSIGGRENRAVAVMEDDQLIVPNIFQLSTGETSLLNLFMSILRDYDLIGGEFSIVHDIRGIVIVDEIDLHLHSDHQYEILPNLIRMFPNVQFIVTTHSPLFILGLRKLLGEDGFDLYQLPDGQKISPEDFSEFGSAYQTFTETRKYANDIRQAIEKAAKPIVFVEGETDIKYIRKAAEILAKEAIISQCQLRDGGGYGGLNNIMKHFDTRLSEVTPQKIVLLYDCDKPLSDSKGNVYRRHVPLQQDNPLEKGIENLFSRETLQGARDFKDAFIDVTAEHTETIRGECRFIPEEWAINSDEKTNLCDWLCENGTVEDFQNFQCVFDLLEELLDINSPTRIGQSKDQVQ